VTDEQGRLTHLFAGKTGRFATKDAKKLVAAKLLVDGINDGTPPPAATRKKRTSRASNPSQPAATKRTSRAAKGAAAPTEATSKRTSRRPRKKAEPMQMGPVQRSSIWNP